MKKLLSIICFSLALGLIGCTPVGPVITPPITMVEPTPAAPTPTATLKATPSYTPLPSDAAFESSAAPLSRRDFTVELQEGSFCLLDQSSSELEKLLGQKFVSNELKTKDLLFTKLDSYVDSVLFTGSATTRGIKSGDTLDAMLEAYGTPSEINDFDSSFSYIFYLDPPESGDNIDFRQSRPLWYYAIGFSVSDGKVDSAFIADWTTG